MDNRSNKGNGGNFGKGGARGGKGGSFGGKKFDGRKGEGRGGENRGGYGKGNGGFKKGGRFQGEGRGSRDDRRDGEKREYRGERRFDGNREDRKQGEGRSFNGERRFNGNRDDRRNGGAGKSFDRNGGNRGPKRFDRRDDDPRDNRNDRRDGEKREFKGERRFNGSRDDRRQGEGRGFKGDRRFDGKKDFKGGKRDFDRKDNFKRDEEEVRTQAPEVAEGEAAQDRPVREERPFRGEERPARRFDRRPKETRLSPARAAACKIGKIVRERDAFTAEVTPTVLAEFEGISPEDAAFATKIARGVTATVGTLDEFINRNMRTPDDIDAEVRDAMRVSAYELLFLGKQSHAAVDQGVELVRSVAPKAAGLANAVLRKMAQSAKAFPFGRADLSLQVLARSVAFPLWLAKRLMNQMGLKPAADFMRACNADAPVFIAVNAIKAKDEDVVEIFDQAGSILKPSADVEGCYLMEDARALRDPKVKALFEQGCVLVSDESAQAIAQLACPEVDVQTFLEIGSGRGTKTILLQSDAVRKFGRTMPMVSVDDHAFKADLLSKRCAAYGITTVRPVTADGRKLSKVLPEASFDAVFVDAPCTGLGTLRRHPEIRWRLTEADITEMASVGLDMLLEAAKMVKVGGMLTYATCTVFEEENAQVVDRFLKTKFGEGFVVEKTIETTLTAAGPDAHYAVRLKRER